MTAETAVRRAWISYVALAATPAVLLLFAVVAVPGSEAPTRPGAAYAFFGLSVGWLAIMMPTALWFRGYVFRVGYAGHRVDGKSYLRGVMSMWVAATIGATLGAVGCLAGNAMLPCVFPAGVGLVLQLLMTPSSRGVETVEPLPRDPAAAA